MVIYSISEGKEHGYFSQSHRSIFRPWTAIYFTGAIFRQAMHQTRGKPHRKETCSVLEAQPKGVTLERMGRLAVFSAGLDLFLTATGEP